MPSGAQLVQLDVDQAEHLGDLARPGAGGDREGAGVGVRRRTGADGVGEAALLADLLEQAAGQAAAEDVVR